jgi:altronate dehydratase
MSNIQEYIERNPQESKLLIGLECEQLQQLIAAAELLHQQKDSEIEQRKIRIIKAERSSFTSTEHLKHQILDFIDYFNRTLAKPFVWKFVGFPDSD